jgi:hypothetical protein
MVLRVHPVRDNALGLPISAPQLMSLPVDDDWKVIGRNKDKLKGILQQKYGRSKEEAQREVDEFSKEDRERKVS